MSGLLNLPFVDVFAALSALVLGGAVIFICYIAFNEISEWIIINEIAIALWPDSWLDKHREREVIHEEICEANKRYFAIGVVVTILTAATGAILWYLAKKYLRF